MNTSRIGTFIVSLLLVSIGIQGCSVAAKEIERPEKILSKRIVVYDVETYQNLAELWKQYYRAFPSEDAYANWMYAARYANDPDYESLLEKGFKKYPANPTLLYLHGMKKYGCHDDLEGEILLEKATRLDPTYMDPWFGLVGYYLDRNPEKLDVALRRLLKGGAIPDMVMDYNYNMLASLDENAILITNGDMDTYPGWILKRILRHRPDVIIANRSLLNTDWYPGMLIKEGLPKFITQSDLEALHENISKEIKEKNAPVPPAGPYSDTLLVRIIEAAAREGRPVYFSLTLMSSDAVDRYSETGRNLGLVTLVTPPSGRYSGQITKLCETWLSEFRTSGLDSWTFRHSDKRLFSWRLAFNYAAGLHQVMDAIVAHAPEYRLNLFRWYKKHLLELIGQKYVDEINKMWCSSTDIKEIRDWCRSQGYLE